MRKLIFATNNTHKLQEIKAIIGGQFIIQGLAEAGFSGDIPETADTLEGNALLKARHVHKLFPDCDCFADDTGLEVDALDGAPGVYSARYAGENATYQENVDKLLAALAGNTQRNARFRTVIALIYKGKEYLFDGKVEGRISESGKGKGGFGYDPVFIPMGYTQSFAELSPEEKNKISHRGLATEKLISFFKSH